MRKSKRRIFALLLAVMLCGAALPVTAAAQGGPEDGVLEYWNQNTAPAQDTAQTVSQKPRQGEPLSQDGGFSTRDLLYDKDTHKQFITVEGRDGNVFYIVIDYDAPVNEDEEQYRTYFLNQVDEADLAALVEAGPPAACDCTVKCAAGAVDTGCPVCAVNMTECAGRDPDPVKPAEPAEPDIQPEPDQKSSTGGLLAVALAVILAGGGAWYVLKRRKKQPDVKGSADLNDYDYGDEDDCGDAGSSAEEDG